ncbi:MAG: hypothetical protein J1F36_02125 [Clostridiales bacterium]|nr:hypothetical protein [Clostridiales bacterium]
MAKLTRKQYTRKRLFAGVVMFAAVALVVTGISVWLLFSSLSMGADGQLKVSEIAISPMSFSVLNVDGTDVRDENAVISGFIFDTQYGDDTGRVTWDGGSYEKMKINISGVLMNAQHLGKFSYVLELPQGVIDAANKGYLDISEFYDFETGKAKEVVVSVAENGSMVADGTTTAWRFNFDIAIKWGELFNHLNPSVYYDTDGIDIPDEEVLRVIDDLKETVMGGGGLFSKPTFKLTITASPNQ